MSRALRRCGSCKRRLWLLKIQNRSIWRENSLSPFAHPPLFLIAGRSWQHPAKCLQFLHFLRSTPRRLSRKFPGVLNSARAWAITRYRGASAAVPWMARRSGHSGHLWRANTPVKGTACPRSYGRGHLWGRAGGGVVSPRRGSILGPKQTDFGALDCKVFGQKSRSNQ